MAALALGRLIWLGQWSRVSTPAGQVVVARLVVPVAVGREGSKRSVVAAAGVMVGLRRRWIRMELGLLMMGAESPVGRR